MYPMATASSSSTTVDVLPDEMNGGGGRAERKSAPGRDDGLEKELEKGIQGMESESTSKNRAQVHVQARVDAENGDENENTKDRTVVGAVETHDGVKNEHATATATATNCPPPITWRSAVRDFSPAWFAVVMGNGIVSILLFSFPYPAHWLRTVSCALFALNVALFLLLVGVTALRFALFPASWGSLLAHPAQSLFIGCFPMALSTLLNMAVLACASWGPRLIYLVWSLWWLEALLSLVSCIAVPFLLFTRHRPVLEATTPAILLPIVPCIIAAGTGSIIAGALPLPSSPESLSPSSDAVTAGPALATLLSSYALLGLGEALSACVLALYFHRLTLHGLPPREALVSMLLPIGPLGQGGFALQNLGRAALSILPSTKAFSITAADIVASTGSTTTSTTTAAAATTVVAVDPSQAAQTLYVSGVLLGLALWAFALVWAAYALVGFAKVRRVPFNLGWWGLTFPLGVWAACASQLWMNLHSEFFKIVTVITTALVLLLWCLVVVKTVQGVISGRAFLVPEPRTLLARITGPEREKADKTV